MKQLLTLSFISVFIAACSNEQLPRTNLSMFNFEESSELYYAFIPFDAYDDEKQDVNFTKIRPLVVKIREFISDYNESIKCLPIAVSPKNTGISNNIGIILFKSFTSEQQAEEFVSSLKKTVPEISKIEAISQPNYKRMLLESSIEQFIKEKKANR